MKTTLRISEQDWVAAKRALFTSDGNENAGILLCGVARISSQETLLVRDFVPVPNREYLLRRPDQLEVSPAFYNNVVSRCVRESLSPILVHSHPGISEAWFSMADDRGELRLLAVFESLLPGLTPGSLVVSNDSAAGRRLEDSKFVSFAGVEIRGATSWSIVQRASERYLETDDRFDRQVRAFGAVGQEVLRDLRVAVVGVGGIGSIVAEQLARLGIGDILLIDNDLIESANLNRQFGAVESDVGKPKANVTQRHLERISTSTIRTIGETAIRQSVLAQLRDRHLILGCVDNDRTRALLNRFAHQYLIPVIDHGTRLDGRGGSISAASGRVTLVGEGMTCLRCSHHLNPDRIRAESLSKKERQQLYREGYVIGIDEPAPAVISINTVVAGLGVTAALNMFLGITGGRQPLNQIYDAKTGSVFAVQSVHDPNCDICSKTGVKGIGDAQIVSAYD